MLLNSSESTKVSIKANKDFKRVFISSAVHNMHWLRVGKENVSMLYNRGLVQERQPKPWQPT